MKRILYFVFALFIVSCSGYNSVQMSSTENRPSIIIPNGTSDAILYVDDISMGSTKQFRKKPLFVEEGVHLIRVIANNEILYQKKVFLNTGQVTTLRLN